MNFIKEHLAGYGVSEQMIVYLSNMIMVLFIALLSVVANFIAKKIVLKIIIHIINNNRYTWDNIFLEKKVFHKLSHLAPAFIIYYAASVFPLYQALITKLALTYMIIVTITVFNALLDAIDAIYRRECFSIPILSIDHIKNKDFGGLIHVLVLVYSSFSKAVGLRTAADYITA